MSRMTHGENRMNTSIEMEEIKPKTILNVGKGSEKEYKWIKGGEQKDTNNQQHQQNIIRTKSVGKWMGACIMYKMYSTQCIRMEHNSPYQCVCVCACVLCVLCVPATKVTIEMMSSHSSSSAPDKSTVWKNKSNRLIMCTCVCVCEWARFEFIHYASQTWLWMNFFLWLGGSI